VAGEEAVGTDIELAHKDTFRAGGFQRGTALAGCRVVDGEVVVGDGGSLGPHFARHLLEYDPVVLERVVACYQGGEDVTRAMVGTEAGDAYLARVRPTDPVARAAVRSRSLAKVQNARISGQFVPFLVDEALTMLRRGAIVCLGRREDVEAEGRCPYAVGRVTVEPSKPRFCVDPRELNSATPREAVELEGLERVRDDCLGQRPRDDDCGLVADEMAGYYNTLVSEESSALLGFVLLGYVFTYRCVPFGWRNGKWWL
jgi:hypothetical protein